jgi:hypothetical protein
MRPRTLVAILAVLGTALVTGGATAPATAATACCGNFRLLYFSGDAIRNYDLLSASARDYNVDWGVDLLFYNNANINKIKDALNGQYGETGSTMYGRMSDDGGATYVWDTDSGRKKGDCVSVYTHYRIYAVPGQDYMYNPAMGYYLFGTTHHHYEECYPPSQSGYSEDAEWQVNTDADNAFGVTNQYGWANFYNTEPYRVEGDHIWDQDGFASYVIVP